MRPPPKLYYAALQGVREAGEDMSAWLEYCAAGLRPLEAGVVEKVGGNKTGSYVLKCA